MLKEDIDETRKILDKLLHKNDKYIAENILSYVYPICIKCNGLFNDSETMDMWNKKYLCLECYRDNVNDYRVCKECKNLFEYNTNIFCRSCRGQCYIFCGKCLDWKERSFSF